ncbi:unnamed protein product [Rotaria sordida]|uniref:Uncharacterized protein n=2 Tax=Rotaria sordida TaxID=392033 RepID=A0A814H973_9BILA|nr:unnamed protein product [Rotaria sordida]CAF1193078.1 unnamed protein product [Rotaria sordida]
MIYTLHSEWQFVQKQLEFKNIDNKTITSVETTFTITNMDIPSASIIFNQQDRSRQHTIFLRNESILLGIFATWQHPFGLYSITSNNQTVTSSYNVGIETSYLSEGFLIGFYQLSPYWHTNHINYADRQAYVNATSFFFTVSPHNQSLKHVVGWDNNDYQIDLSPEHGIEEYKRLINRCAQLGITSITFAPSNSNVSRRDQGTDDWGWESVLWMSLGEKIRLEQWKPYRDPIPSEIQYLLNYAAMKQVKLVPYVYPPLGYRLQGQDQAWLVENPHCRNLCASLASIEFQRYFLQLLIDFVQVTDIGGYAWDYNYFFDTNHTAYSQWRGWQWVRTQLLLALPHLIMDHRYGSQYDGPWSWVTLNGYTSPLLADENPETYPILYPSLHTDKIATNFMLPGNRELRLEHFGSMENIPGFIGHQSERFSADGRLPWQDHDIRDFDLMGFPYSLLANVASAGLNLIHNMIAARDLQEYYLLPERTLQFWTYWIQWTDKHIEEIRNSIPFLTEHNWSLMKLNGINGFLFLFNPNYVQEHRMIRLDGQLNIKSPTQRGYWLLSEIYPEQKYLQLIEYNQTLDFLLDGQSATVFELSFISTVSKPILVGVSGTAFIANKNILMINGVYGEAGTQTTHPIFVIMPEEQVIESVILNGNEKRFQQVKEFIILIDVLSFPGQYLPRSAQIMNKSIIVSDLLLQQFIERQQEYPIAWTDDELNEVAWLGSHRLLLFICIVNPDDRWNVTAQINNVTVIVHKGYNTRDTHNRDRFMGLYLDLTNVVQKPNIEYTLSLEMPTLDPGLFQGLFLENIERILVEA